MKEQKLEFINNPEHLRQYIPLILSLISIVTLLVLLVKILIPETISSIGRFEELNKDKSKIIKLEKKIRILSEFKQKTLIDLIEKSKLVIPANNDLGSTIIYLKNLARKSNIEMTELSLQVSDSQTNILNLEIAGGKEEIFSFLRLLSKPDGRILITNNIMFKIRNKTSDQERDTYSVSLTIAAPYSTFPDKLVAVTGEIPELTNEQRSRLSEIAQITLKTSDYKVKTPVVDFEPRDNPFEF